MQRHALPLLLLSALTFASAQDTRPTPAPGLRIPNGSIPYAFDHFQGRPQIVPIHHTTVEVNNHKGANVAGSLAGSVFYKPKMTVEVAGAHARTVLHDASPAIYLHRFEDPGAAEDSPDAETGTFAIVRAIPDKDRRVFAQIRFTQLTGNAKRNDGIVDSIIEKLPGGWIRLTPAGALEPGEYAVTPVQKAQNTFSTIVFDFRIDPAAPPAADAISAKAGYEE